MSPEKPDACPGPEKLARAVSEGPDAALESHFTRCPRCKTEWASLAQLRQLTREIPVALPPRHRVEAVRTALLTGPRIPPRVRWERAAIPAALATVAAGLLLFLWRGPPPGAPEGGLARLDHRGTVRAQGTARFVHDDGRHDETVRLTDGHITVDVEPLRPGQRFRVIVGDAEIEVRGTSFEVLAENDHLERVSVRHGLVEVRTAGAAPTRLRSGDTWQSGQVTSAQAPTEEAAPPAEAAPPTQATPEGAALALPPVPLAPPAAPPEAAASTPRAPSPPAPRPLHPEKTLPPLRPGTLPPAEEARPKRTLAVAAAPARRPPAPADIAPGMAPQAEVAAPPARAANSAAPPAPATGEAESPADQAFAIGWQALLRKDYAAAAQAFTRASEAAGTRPIAEDARFWQGVAHARAHNRPEAIRALRTFVARYPRSPRAAEGASILGWLLLEEQTPAALDEAERLFQSAANAPLTNIRESARAGLATIATRRKPTP